MNKKIVVIIFAVALSGYVFFVLGGQQEVDRRRMIEETLVDMKKRKRLTPDREAAARVQLAVADFTAENQRPPASLDQLIPVYFDSVPVNPATKEPFEYELKNGQPLLGNEIRLAEAKKQQAQEEASEDQPYSILASLDLGDGSVKIVPSMVVADTFIYDPTGLRDPFTPFGAPDNGADDENRTELERYSLGQLKLTIVMTDMDGEFFAMVENSEGKGYKVRKGTKIGNRNGEVVEIQADRLKILQQHTTFTGEEKNEVVELTLNNQ